MADRSTACVHTQYTVAVGSVTCTQEILQAVTVLTSQAQAVTGCWFSHQYRQELGQAVTVPTSQAVTGHWFNHLYRQELGQAVTVLISGCD